MTRRARSSFAAVLAASSVFAGAAFGSGGVRSTDARPAAPPAPALASELRADRRLTWSGELRDEHRAIAAWLRAARARRGDSADLRAQVVALRAAALAPALDVLVQACVPAAASADEPQKLSAAQSQWLLELVAQCELADVRAALEARVAADHTPEAGLVALRVYAVAGDVKDLARLAVLVSREPDGALSSAAREALRAAYTGILVRHPEALGTAGALVEAVDDTAAEQLLLAFGELRDPRAIEILFRVAQRDAGLAQTAVAMVPRIGTSRDANLDAEFAAWLRGEIRPDRTEWTRALVRALGELDDGEAAPELIALLGHAHKGIADAALAALRRMSRLAYPPQAALWQAWYEREVKWYDRERARQRNALERGRVPAALEALRAYSQHEFRRTQLAQDVCGAFSRREAPVRELACEVLGGLGARAALPALVEALGDPTTSVANAAWRALQRITGATLPNDHEAWSAYAAAPGRPAAEQSLAR